MSLYGTSPIKRSRRTHTEQESLDRALYTIVEGDLPMTVRQVFYQATVRGLVPKDEAKGYRVVQRRLVALREAGLIPYHWITDNARMVRGVDRWDGPQHFAARAAELYRRDYWARSDVRVEVWLEKDALAGVLYPIVVSEWGLDLFVTRGFASVSYLESAAAAARYDGRPQGVRAAGLPGGSPNETGGKRMSDVIGAAKAAKWLGLSEETVRKLCREGKLEGAFQPAGYQGKWLIPVEALEAIRACPEWLQIDLSNVA
jgi:hypothetical protein